VARVTFVLIARTFGLSGGLALVGALCSCGSGQPPAPDWQLSWSDEFTEATLDPAKWNVDLGDSFGTGQQDYDTARPVNLSVSGGNLVITARAESYDGASYTSARIETQGKFAQAYGKFEARIQIPSGQGMWPAFWLLGDDYTEVGWPQCGELDITEARGASPGTVLGSMHGPGGDSYTAVFSLPGGASFSDDFHVFDLEWEPGVARWYVDGQLYETQSADLLPANQPWVFDHPFFVILNLAVGGSFGGPIESSTPLPQSMLVDYVRVYTNGPNAADAGTGPTGDGP
jgi:beta-glucanase (GH16 family)